MPRSLLIALLLLVATPLVLLGWLSASAHQQQQRRARDQLTQFFQGRLSEIDRSLSEVFDGYGRSLRSAMEQEPLTIDSVRQLELEHPIVRSTIYVDRSGILLHPPKPQPEQSEKVALFAALPAIISSRPDLGPAPVENVGQTAKGIAVQRVAGPIANTLIGDGTWQVWYMDEGAQLILWLQTSNGAAVGILLERARVIADLIAKLPDTQAAVPTVNKTTLDAEMPSGFTALTDEARQIIYRWGDGVPASAAPLATRNLSPPLASWHLEYHNRDPLADAPPTALLIAPIAGIAILLISLGAYVLTSVQRQMRSAKQRVSFASQVSHELRTPLTNIRLYAELAERDLQQLPDNPTKDSVGRRLEVIDTESRRLGRLVSGVLEMIRDPRKQRPPRISQEVADEIIDNALTQFSPSFDRAGIQVNRHADAPQLIGIDADLLELILVNLLSNVEKYATDGGSVTVRSQFQDGDLIIDVFDQGPGIPWHHRQRVFRPFTRLDDSISAPSGTGIGLTIARQLAKRHGGDLELVQDPQHRGACFRLRIRAQSGDRGIQSEQAES
jgi:signal transduction histidine kinase